jgi:hypothetical protein
MKNKLILSDKAYNIIKSVPLYISALATAYVGLGAIWGWSYTDEIAKSATVVNVLILALLRASSWAYSKQLKEELDNDEL